MIFHYWQQNIANETTLSYERELNINSSRFLFRPLHSLCVINFSAVTTIILEYSNLQDVIYSDTKTYESEIQLMLQ